jgi:GTP-binding protein
MIDITNEDIKKSYKQVKTELKNYSSKLSKKKEIIVLNKIDLISKNKLKQIVDNFSKNTKSEIMTVSTLKKNSISKVKAKLISYAS